MLTRLLEYKREEVEESKALTPLAELKRRVAEAPSPRDLVGALRGKKAGGGIHMIAELKKASPSKGLLCPNFRVEALARAYTEGGASAISVLTDRRFFQGQLENLTLVRRASHLPLLRKDFIFDPYQLWEARAWGADGVLLIVAALEIVCQWETGAEAGSLDPPVLAQRARRKLMELTAVAGELGLATLVEVHDGRELEVALASGAEIIGINNRNLKSFQVSLQTTLDLGPRIPAGKLVVTESGVNSAEDVELLARAGVDAVLVGEALVRSADPAAKVRELASAGRKERRLRPAAQDFGT